ncbi:MAG TPA: S-layer protein, partial [Planctomycetaceae bacterium]|nr:S-layer protein [Planctomycetaceae bacterium]
MKKLLTSALLLVVAFSVQPLLSADAELVAPGLGDPGDLVKINIVTGRTVDGKVLISGRDAGQQLLINGDYTSGQTRDLTRDAQITITPEGIISIDETGYVSPVAEGDATIHVKTSTGQDASVKVTVTNIVVDLPVNFPNQVTPVFTKFGCNGGGCHGKSGGQNGFRLSLLGFEPAEDFEFLVKEAKGRRLFPAAPDRSLLLQKGAGTLPHGGGARLDPESASYRLLYRWIEQGMPYGNADDPVVTHIKVFPEERLMGREADQQINVVAYYSDGSSEDVTRTTSFDSNDTEMAEVTPNGLVTTSKLTGSVAVMAL